MDRRSARNGPAAAAGCRLRGGALVALGLLLVGCTADPGGTGGGDAGPDGAAGNVYGDLHGAFLELECMSEKIELQFCVPKDMGMRSVRLKFGGEPGRSYSVVLKVWGVVEAVRYVDGTKGGTHFYIGGRGSTPMTAEYTLDVAGEQYHLNHFDNNPGEHYTYAIQYTAPAIVIPGAADIVLSVSDPDNLVNTNHMEIAVASPPPALREKLEKMQDGRLRWQYVYLEVASVQQR